MMKKQFLLAIFSLLLTTMAIAENRVVFVSLDAVFNGFYKTKLTESKIEMQQNDIENERQKMSDELVVINEEIDELKEAARDKTLLPEIRDSKRFLYEERLLDLRAKQEEIEEFLSSRQEQLKFQMSRMVQTIMDEIHQTIIKYAQRNGLHAVIDNSRRQNKISVFLYTHPDVDITPQILELLNRKRPRFLEKMDEMDKTDEINETEKTNGADVKED